jgi:hypothetical protein
MTQALTTRSDWLAAHPPARERLTQTLARVADRSRAGEEFRHVVREFLDEFTLRGDDRSRAVAIAQAPAAFRRRGVFVPERSLHRV